MQDPTRAYSKQRARLIFPRAYAILAYLHGIAGDLVSGGPSARFRCDWRSCLLFFYFFAVLSNFCGKQTRPKAGLFRTAPGRFNLLFVLQDKFHEHLELAGGFVNEITQRGAEDVLPVVSSSARQRMRCAVILRLFRRCYNEQWVASRFVSRVLPTRLESQRCKTTFREAMVAAS